MSFYKHFAKNYNSKSSRQKAHAKRRLQQRFPNVNPKNIYLWEKMIKNGKSTFVESQSNRISLHDIQHKGKTIRCVYDKLRNNIVTVLYPDELMVQ